MQNLNQRIIHQNTPTYSLRIVLVTGSMGVGGAERVLALLANSWVHKGWNVYVIDLSGGRIPNAYKLDPKVVFIMQRNISSNGSKFHKGFNRIRRICWLRNTLKSLTPNLVIAFANYTSLITSIGMTGLSIPLILTERADPHGRYYGLWWDLFHRVFYRRAGALVAVSQAALDYFSPKVYKHGLVIPNPVPPPPCRSIAEDGNIAISGYKRMIGMGRLDQVKGFDRALEAFGMVFQKHPDWRFEIWGEGVDRERLEAILVKAGLSNVARLCGHTEDPYGVMLGADLFVLSSHTEGFPNVLCEAMATGVPVISFDCSSGPREIIRDGIDGLLVANGNMSALAAAMDRLMSDVAERQNLVGPSP